MAEIYVTEYKMKTFKEYFLSEDRVNWSKYGSWINAKTREVLDVDEQEHNKKMIQWMNDNGKTLKKGFIGNATDWAIDNDWVRLAHHKYAWPSGKSISIQGSIKNIKKMWRMIAKKAMKSILDIDLSRRDGGSQPFASNSFDMTLPKERNEWLRYM